MALPGLRWSCQGLLAGWPADQAWRQRQLAVDLRALKNTGNLECGEYWRVTICITSSFFCVEKTTHSKFSVQVSDCREADLCVQWLILREANDIYSFIYIYICIYICKYVYIYIYTHMCIHTYIYIYMYVHLNIPVYIYIYVCIYIYVHLNIPIYICICIICMYISQQVCV